MTATSGPTVSVLIVDDDAMVRGWLQLSLHDSEFRIVGEAADLAEAHELVRRRRPHLVLVDQKLAGESGTELIRSLRMQEPGIRLVLMTATPERGLNESAREAGAHGSMLKTGQPADVLRTLRAIAAGRRAYDARHPPREVGVGALTPRERAAARRTRR